VGRVWAAWARLGELPMNATDAPTALRYHGRVATDVPFLVEGSVGHEDGQTLTMRAVVTQAGVLKAEMTWPMRRRTLEEIERSLQRPRLPRSNRAELEEMRRRRLAAQGR
jgi:hypothetical protein